MKKYWYKLLNWIGFEIEEVAEDKNKINVIDTDARQNYRPAASNIISLHQNKPVKIVHINPVDYEQVQEIADHLRNMRPVIVNLETVEKNGAKRILDFLYGTTYAISGSMQKINANIFIVLPQNFSMVQIAENKKTILKNEGLILNKTRES